MIAPTRPMLAMLGLLLVTTPAVAQITPPPRPGAPGTEEAPPASTQRGPLGVRPALILGEIGSDSNVLNRNTDEQGDVRATVGGRVDVGARVARLLTSYEARLDEPQVIGIRLPASGSPAEGLAPAFAKTRGSPSTATTRSGARRCRRGSIHPAGCM